MTTQKVAQENREEARWLLSYGRPVAEVAERCHLHIHTVQDVAAKMGLKSNKDFTVSQTENFELAKRMTEVLVAIQLRRGVSNVSVIASSMNLDRKTVALAIKRIKGGRQTHEFV